MRACLGLAASTAAPLAVLTLAAVLIFTTN